MNKKDRLALLADNSSFKLFVDSMDEWLTELLNSEEEDKKNEIE